MQNNYCDRIKSLQAYSNLMTIIFFIMEVLKIYYTSKIAEYFSLVEQTMIFQLVEKYF